MYRSKSEAPAVMRRGGGVNCWSTMEREEGERVGLGCGWREWGRGAIHRWLWGRVVNEVGRGRKFAAVSGRGRGKWGEGRDGLGGLVGKGRWKEAAVRERGL